MRVGWLVDHADHVGGAELTQAEFRAAAPDGVEIVDCRPQAVYADCDRYVVQNCVQYTLEDFAVVQGKPVTKFWHDIGMHVDPQVIEWLARNAFAICCSPIQAKYMGLDSVPCIPPPIDLARFERAAAAVNGDRSGQVCVGSWRNHGKAAHRVAAWAQTNGVTVDFFGDGPFAPRGSQPVPYDAMPTLLAQYERFVFLPKVLEPFGRVVAEAWGAGCELIVNGQVGATYWIRENPEAMDTAAENFWDVVLA